MLTVIAAPLLLMTTLAVNTAVPGLGDFMIGRALNATVQKARPGAFSDDTGPKSERIANSSFHRIR